jgi:CheY-like chemotaxis protein
MSVAIEKLSVLVVEDEGLISMFIEDMLTDMGHEIGAVAASMEAAMQAAATGSFGLAIVDVNLDGTPSYPVAEILRSRGIPFVLATGYGAAGLDPGYAGASSTLQKPFTQEDLHAALLRIIASRPRDPAH